MPKTTKNSKRLSMDSEDYLIRRNDAQRNYALWSAKARDVGRTDNPLDIPYEIALAEAIGLARFIITYWEPAGDRPGLKAVKARLPAETAEEMLSLVRAVQEAQTRLLLLVDPVVVDVGERARFVCDELESALDFVLDDAMDEPADSQLARIREFHSQDGQRSSALAQSLRDYAALASSLRTRLVAADASFDPELIEEAVQLAETLMRPREARGEGDSAAAMAVRNQMLHLLVQRIGLVRRTASHVFRHHPEIVREATSAYERRRRAAARREKLRQAGPPASARQIV